MLVFFVSARAQDQSGLVQVFLDKRLDSVREMALALLGKGLGDRHWRLHQAHMDSLNLYEADSLRSGQVDSLQMQLCMPGAFGRFVREPLVGAKAAHAVAAHGNVELAYQVLSPLVEQVLRDRGFFEAHGVDGRAVGLESKSLASVFAGAIYVMRAIGSIQYGTDPGYNKPDVDKMIALLRLQGADVVIYWSYSMGNIPMPDTLGDQNFRGLYSKDFFLYRQQGKVYSIVKVDGFDGSEKDIMNLISKPQLLVGCTIPDWLGDRVDSIRRERIYPLIVMGNWDGVAHYEDVSPLHDIMWIGWFHAKGRTAQTSFNLSSLEPECKRWDSPSPNLNYEGNIGTNIYRLYRQLDALERRIKKGTIF